MRSQAACATATAASSNAIESRPPDSATAAAPPPGSEAASADATADRRRSAGPGSAGGNLLESPIGEDLVFARLEQRVERLLLQVTQHLGERLLQRHHHRRVVAMGSAQRLVDDLVDQPELLQPGGGDPERLGGLGRMFGRFPEDRRATLGRYHRIRCILQHQRDVADAGVGAGRVDEREQRKPEFLGELHQAQRLAVTLGARHAEIAVDLLLGIAALLLAEDHAGHAVEPREAADDRRVVSVRAIAVQLAELAEHAVDVVERVRTLRMTRDLRDLPGGELAVDVLGKLLALLGQPQDLVGDVDGGILVHVAQLVDLLLQLANRLLEVEKGLLHGCRDWWCARIIAQTPRRAPIMAPLQEESTWRRIASPSSRVTALARKRFPRGFGSSRKRPRSSASRSSSRISTGTATATPAPAA